jgi:hypothetical protein
MQTFSSGLNCLLGNFVKGMIEPTTSQPNFKGSDDNGAASSEEEEMGDSSSSEEEEEAPIKQPCKRVGPSCSRVVPKADGNVVGTPEKDALEDSTNISPPAMHSQIMIPSSNDTDGAVMMMWELLL